MKAITNSKQSSLKDILEDKLASAKEIIFCVSFIKSSGVDLLFSYLKRALTNNAKVSILTSTYLNVTEPVALYKLKSLNNDNFSLSIFDHNKFKTSFHIKGYYFKFMEDSEEMVIGSSNISQIALTTGLEWNILFDEKTAIKEFLSQYDDIVENYSFNPSDEWLQKYLMEYKPITSEHFKPDFDPSHYFKPETDDSNPNPQPLTSSKYKPIKCQIPALYELERTRKEGFNKALIVMATGLGKTFLSAFDSKKFKRVLFVAHRQEILIQAKETFKKIRTKASFGDFNADIKETDKDIIFASISTIGKNIYLNDDYFSSDYFDYIIVDEFHHSAANSYLSFLDYFTPKFLLGLTATPDRLDNKDIYQYCDYNIAFQCNFKTAINNGWLVPFTYYGIYDDIDYEKIPWRSGRYDINELENVYMVDQRANNIIKNYREKARKSTLAFCCSVKHADYTANQFQKNNINAVALHSGINSRTNIIEDFSQGKISVLCVVDIFNEGVDIPHIDTVMFLRPTESFTIFIQQLGRGLRTSNNKDKLIILDFVGNYKNSHFKLSYLAGLTPRDIKKKTSLSLGQTREQLPVSCILDIEPKLIDLFEVLRNKKLPLKQRLIENYLDIKDSLDDKYSLSEFNAASDLPGRIYLKTFGSWLDFLISMYPENATFKIIKKSKIASFLSEVEKTSMTKLYKIPTILALVYDNQLHNETHITNIVASFKTFYNSSINAKDLTDESNSNFKEWTEKEWKHLAEKNPIHYLTKRDSSIFMYDAESAIFSLRFDPEDLVVLRKCNKQVLAFVKDIINYRRQGYIERKKFLDQN